jgi:hypothetical protein
VTFLAIRIPISACRSPDIAGDIEEEEEEEAEEEEEDIRWS